MLYRTNWPESIQGPPHPRSAAFSNAPHRGRHRAQTSPAERQPQLLGGTPTCSMRGRAPRQSTSHASGLHGVSEKHLIWRLKITWATAAWLGRGQGLQPHGGWAALNWDQSLSTLWGPLKWPYHRPCAQDTYLAVGLSQATRAARLSPSHRTPGLAAGAALCRSSSGLSSQVAISSA